MNTECQILGHLTILNRFDTSCLQFVGKVCQFFIIIQCCSVFQTTCPCKDGCNWIRRCLLSLLPKSPMSCHCTMRSFGFLNLSIRGHQPQGSISLSQYIRLDIAIIILTSPNEGTIRLQHLRNHIINQSMLIPNAQIIKLCLIILVKYILENILEQAIIFFQNCILCRQVDWPFLQQSILKTTVRKTGDTLLCIVHSHATSTALWE